MYMGKNVLETIFLSTEILPVEDYSKSVFEYNIKRGTGGPYGVRSKNTARH